MNSDDVSSSDAIVRAAYDVISGPAGQPRDWDRERSLFFPGARLIPTAAKAGDNASELAQVWSTYESRHSENDPEPFMRGINSIQLFNDGTRWWIITIYWQHESPDDPLPEKYLPRS